MSFRRLTRKLKRFCVPLALLMGLQSVGLAQECGAGGCATGQCGGSGGGLCCRDWFHCPKCRFCLPGPPCLKFKYGCPLPCCCPADAPNWGYYQPCWRPWPWPPNWSHCPYQVPAATVVPCPQPNLPGPAAGPVTSAPAARYLPQAPTPESSAPAPGF